MGCVIFFFLILFLLSLYYFSHWISVALLFSFPFLFFCGLPIFTATFSFRRLEKLYRFFILFFALKKKEKVTVIENVCVVRQRFCGR